MTDLGATLHDPNEGLRDLIKQVGEFIVGRYNDRPIGRTASQRTVDDALAGTITDSGLGPEQAWKIFEHAVEPNTLTLDSHRFLAFLPMCPSVASVCMDAAVGAASFGAESWLEAAGAVAAENQVLDVFIDAARMPNGSGGCFMSGGSIGNLSALATARAGVGHRRTVAVADTAHASVYNSLQLLGLESIVVDTGSDARLTADALWRAVRARPDVGIIVAAAGSTNGGVIDDLDGAACVADEIDAWFHVDGAYGAAAMLLPEMRAAFDGIERADSWIVDPHKWLFAPAGSCALIYRQPALAAAVHTQHGPYIDALRIDEDAQPNPSDLGFQLTRRATGLPLWFALAVHGIESHRDAIRTGIRLASNAADVLAATPHVDLVIRPQLGVVLFRRHEWTAAEWATWAMDLLERGVAFIAPSTFRGEPVGRLVFMHPLTPTTLIEEIAETLN